MFALSTRICFILSLGATGSSTLYTLLGLDYLNEAIGYGLTPWIAFPMALISGLLAIYFMARALKPAMDAANALANVADELVFSRGQCHDMEIPAYVRKLSAEKRAKLEASLA